MKRTPLRKVSKKAQLRHYYYTVARRKYLVNHVKCEVCQVRVAHEIHHKKGRCGIRLCDDRYFLAVCLCCHEKITFNPKWAMEKGYSLDRLGI